ncbi:hypothetical protein L7F22_044013 [Adiantum nelumboides]|nr:hypothetical protein [Adiantum nelumboides]
MKFNLLSTVSLAVALLGLSNAHSLSPRSGPLPYEDDTVSNANCQRQTYSVKSTANRTEFDVEKMGVARNINQTQITELFVNFTTGLVRNDTAPFQTTYIKGMKEVTQTFQISGVYCEPKKGRKSETLQVLVHGIGFDGNYWNFHNEALGVKEQDYSYAYAAAEKGFSTFRYDRLGTGASERPEDGYNVAQAPTEVGILISIADMVKNSNKVGNRKWSKTVLIGHSYGSVQSQALSKLRPDLADGLILTGFSTYTMGLPFYLLSTVYTQAKSVFPKRLGNAPPSWLVTGTDYSGQQNFAYPYFVTEGANKLQRETEQPVTQGSLFTIANVGGVAQSFKGPVQVVLPDKDFIFALSAGEQNGKNLAEESAKTLYPSSKNATGILIANSGHGLAFHTVAKGANQRILQFIKGNGF